MQARTQRVNIIRVLAKHAYNVQAEVREAATEVRCNALKDALALGSQLFLLAGFIFAISANQHYTRLLALSLPLS